MTKKFLFIFSLFCYSCNEQDTTIDTSEDIAKSISEATSNTLYFEGKFIRFEKITGRNYFLYLKDSTGNTIKFDTQMPIGEYEISMLQTTGNNIKLNYINFYNKVRKENMRIVKYMEPVYDWSKLPEKK